MWRNETENPRVSGSIPALGKILSNKISAISIAQFTVRVSHSHRTVFRALTLRPWAGITVVNIVFEFDGETQRQRIL